MSSLLEPGSLFAGRYRIERFLAKGGFGAVFVAEQVATELRVAIKVLHPHVLESTTMVEKFQQEARIAGRVNTDHIVRVLDAGVDDATEMPFLVMELLEGQDLEKVLIARGALSKADVVRYLAQAAAGLDKAHRYVDREGRPSPIIHRDLKPENLFLTDRDDGTHTIKILDFGIAKVLGETTKVTREAAGTPLFMAYEQLAGERVSAQTDIWALGLIAFQLLTGKVYWKSAHGEGSTTTRLFGEILALPIDPPSQRLRELGVPNDLGAAFDTWFLGCVARDPTERPASAGAAIAQLAAALDEAGAYAVLAETLQTHGSAHPDALALAATHAVSRSAMLTIDPAALGHTIPRADALPPQRSRATLLGATAAVALVLGAVAVLGVRAIGAPHAPVASAAPVTSAVLPAAAAPVATITLAPAAAPAATVEVAAPASASASARPAPPALPVPAAPAAPAAQTAHPPTPNGAAQRPAPAIVIAPVTAAPAAQPPPATRPAPRIDFYNER